MPIFVTNPLNLVLFNRDYPFTLGLNRKNIVDTRVHCCLYFIPPYGHGLRQIDLEFLKRLQYKVNLVPVIAKADTLTKPEVCFCTSLKIPNN